MEQVSVGGDRIAYAVSWPKGSGAAGTFTYAPGELADMLGVPLADPEPSKLAAALAADADSASLDELEAAAELLRRVRLSYRVVWEGDGQLQGERRFETRQEMDDFVASLEPGIIAHLTLASDTGWRALGSVNKGSHRSGHTRAP